MPYNPLERSFPGTSRASYVAEPEGLTAGPVSHFKTPPPPERSPDQDEKPLTACGRLLPPKSPAQVCKYLKYWTLLRVILTLPIVLCVFLFEDTLFNTYC